MLLQVRGVERTEQYAASRMLAQCMLIEECSSKPFL
eukprot:SAG31_NODE_13400_length_872_cov_1.037516_2_plen_35_part_01